MAICTATIKLNTKEVLKCINALKLFKNTYLFMALAEKETDHQGYMKLLKDFEKIYEDMLEKYAKTTYC